MMSLFTGIKEKFRNNNFKYLFNSFISEYLIKNKLAQTNKVNLPTTFIVTLSNL